MSNLPEGVVVKNTFLETDASLRLPVRRVMTAGGEFASETSDVLPAPKPKNNKVVLPVLGEPSSSEEDGGTGWIVSWISSEAFKNTSAKEELARAASGGGAAKVKCYKTADKFLRTFTKKFVLHPTTCGVRTIVVVDPDEFDSLMETVGAMPPSTFRGVLKFSTWPEIFAQIAQLTN